MLCDYAHSNAPEICTCKQFCKKRCKKRNISELLTKVTRYLFPPNAGLNKSAFKHILLILRGRFNGFPYVSYVLSMTASVYVVQPPLVARARFL